MREPTRYWFPAKRYGWGWGLPSCWQGWVVLGAFGIAMLIGGMTIDVPAHPLGFALYAVSATLVLLVICLAKGEPPRWRWGGD